MSLNNEKVEDRPVIIVDDVSDIEKSTSTAVTNSSPDAEYITPPDGGRGCCFFFANFMLNK
jgi:hypothetical protein